ncbi:AcrR family transcriptional regulator [Micrococcus sp. 140720015-1]
MRDPLTRDRIVDELIVAAGELDVRSASTRVIARRLGVSIGAVQHHYPARADLLLDAFAEVSRRVAGRVLDAEFARRDAGDWVAALTQLLPLDAERRAESHVYMELSSVPDPTGRIGVARRMARRSMMRTISSQLGEWLDGRLSPSLQESLAWAIIQLVDGAALAMTDDATGLEDQRIAFETGLHAMLDWARDAARGG